MNDQEKFLYKFGPFMLDKHERLLIRDRKPIDLRPKAFDMLVMFVENPKKLLLKDEFLQKIWHDAEVQEGNLTHVIADLRKALGDDPDEQRYIATVPKYGYRFRETVEKVLHQEITSEDQYENRAVEARGNEAYNISVNSNLTKEPLALADDKLSTTRSFANGFNVKAPSESFGAWLLASTTAKRLPRTSFDEHSLLKMGECTVLRTAVDPGGYEDIVMEQQQQAGDIKSGIAIDDLPLWEKALEKSDAEKTQGISAQVIQFLPELTDDPKARVKYRVVSYKEANAFHKILQNDPTLSHRYREDTLYVLSDSGTNVPNILVTAIVAIIGSDAKPQLVLANRLGRGSYHGKCWAVSIAEQYKPITETRPERIIEADGSIFTTVERGLYEELLSDGYSRSLNLSVHAFVREDYIDNFFFLAIADLRPLTFDELKELWHKSVDSVEHTAIAALPLSKDVLLECMQADALPENCWSRIQEAGLLEVQPGIILTPGMHHWQPNSHIRLAGCLWYLQNQLT